MLKIVGKTFISLGERFGYETLVNFGTSGIDCELCEQLDIIWRELAIHCRSIPNLTVGSFDVAKNEVPNLHILSVPAIGLITNNELIWYSGTFDLQGIKEFL